MDIYNRLYSGAEDLQAVLALMRKVRPAERIADSPSPDDLYEALSLEEVRQNTRLWLDQDGRLVGFACVTAYNNLWFEIGPQANSLELEKEMVAWGEACIRRTGGVDDDPLALDGSCREDDLERLQFFARHGFVMQTIRTLHLERALDEPIPAPELPPGFTIRHVRAASEVPALVALHRAAFGSGMMTVEERLAMMGGIDYEAELDLVAVAPDGRLAAYCFCWISAEENARSGRLVGYTDPVATHPHFQRRGLAKALLLEGMSRLCERGMRTAALGTSSENTGMLAAARAAGFRVVFESAWFSKPVKRAEELAADG